MDVYIDDAGNGCIIGKPILVGIKTTQIYG